MDIAVEKAFGISNILKKFKLNANPEIINFEHTSNLWSIYEANLIITKAIKNSFKLWKKNSVNLLV